MNAATWGSILGQKMFEAGRIGAWTLALMITARASSAAQPNQSELLKRAGETIDRYCGQLTNIVAEEHYTQRISLANGAPYQSRALVSDLLFVWIPKEMSWVEFRDVYHVDGAPVRDRERRLEALFLKPDDERIATTMQIRNESARYNIGGIDRNLNVPTLILRALLPTEQGRFRFSEGGEQRIDGTETAVLRFEEVSSPALVKDPVANQDLPSTGTFWIEPDTGQVVKSEMVVMGAGERLRARMVVEYKFVPEIGTWAPVVMEEFYDQPPLPNGWRITGRATYDNFRRFRVDVKEEVGGTDR